MAPKLHSILPGKGHRSTFIELVKKAKSTVYIVSPWISGDVLIDVIENLPSGCQLKLVFRWPSNDDNPRLLDLESICSVMGRGDVDIQWVDKSEPLHAKVYCVTDVGAIITSANLTNMGFPSEKSHPGNIELGVLIKDKKLLHEVTDWFSKLVTQSFEKDHAEDLEKWHRDFGDWSRKAREQDLMPPPPPPGPSQKSGSAAREALQHAKHELKIIRDYRQVLKGRGRNAFVLDLNSKRPNYAVRVLTSIASTNPPGEYEASYHFEIPVKDVKDWHSNDKSSFKGIVLVPVKQNEGVREFDQKTPLAFVPFSFLFKGKKNLPITPFSRNTTHSNKPPTLFLSKKLDGNWIIRASARGGERVIEDLKGCLDSCARLKSSAQRWQRKAR